MIPPFDVFRIGDDGGIVWKGSEKNLEDAKARVGELAADDPGEYMIVSLQTGNKILVKAGGAEVQHRQAARDSSSPGC